MSLSLSRGAARTFLGALGTLALFHSFGMAQASTASLNGSEMPLASQIVDSSGNTWALSSSKTILENSKAAGFTQNVSLVLYFNDVIYQLNDAGGWWSWNGSGWASASDPRNPSASGATAPTAAQLVDGSKNVWVVASGVVYENGVKAAYTANVTLLLYYQGTIYHKNSSDNWWSWSGSDWVGTSDPRTPTPSPTPTSSPLTFTITSSSVSPASVSPGQTLNFTTTLRASASVANVNVDLELRNPANTGNVQKNFSGESFAAGQSKTYSWQYQMPVGQSAGPYRITVGVFDSAWSTNYYWNDSAATLSVSGRPSVALPGVNLSGADFNINKVGAQANVDYVYPNNSEVDYFASKGMKVIRLPFDLDRLQPRRLSALDSNEFALLESVVKYANSKGLVVLLDPHNYGYLNDNSGTLREIGVDPLLPNSMYADFWSRMATAFAGRPNVIFGLMNEPYHQTASQWHDSAVAAVKAIRATGATQKIFIPGTSYTGAHSWLGSGNAAAWAGFSDSNFAFEVHQYLDSDSSGTSNTCVSGKGGTVLADVTNWARANKFQAFLGEIGWSNDSSCVPEGQAIMDYMSANADVWYGYSYWAAGPWWGDYMFSIEPKGLGTGTVTDQPQMSILRSQF